MNFTEIITAPKIDAIPSSDVVDSSSICGAFNIPQMEVISGVYKIYSKVNPNKFYVGSAVNFAARKRGHIYTLKTNRHKNPKLQAHFNKYGINDLVFVLLENVLSKDILIEREQYYINLLNPSFNVCKIAGSSLGVKRTDEFKIKVSTSKKGKHHRPECSLEKSKRQMGRKSALGYRHTEEAKARISNNNPRKRRVLQYDTDGCFIKEWESVKQAADTLGLCVVSINLCCRGKIQTSGGYRWIQSPSPGYRLSDEEIIKLGQPRKRKLIQYDLKGGLIKEWPSMREAATSLGLSISTICNCCRGKTKTSGGFKWKYKN